MKRTKALKLSIVIPVYNEENYLGACLDSIAAQLEQPDEVIVVNNNSTDRTVAIARRYDFVRIIKEPLQGVAFARTTGFNAARGDIIGRLDADSVLPPNWVSYIKQFYGDPSHADTAWTGGGYFYNLRLRRLVSLVQTVLIFGFNHLLLGYFVLWGSNQALPRRLWQAVADDCLTEPGIHEDIDLAIHLHKAGFKIRYDRRLLVGAMMRRMRSNRQNLWDYLQWWPRTLRRNGYKTWPLCWLVGVCLIYAASPLPVLTEKLARLLGRRPLSDDN